MKTTQQLQLAITQCLQQAMNAGMPPVVVIGVLECSILDLHAILRESMREAQQQSATVAPDKVPNGGN
jgi:hypothetical protein